MLTDRLEQNTTIRTMTTRSMKRADQPKVIIAEDNSVHSNIPSIKFTVNQTDVVEYEICCSLKAAFNQNENLYYTAS